MEKVIMIPADIIDVLVGILYTRNQTKSLLKLGVESAFGPSTPIKHWLFSKGGNISSSNLEVAVRLNGKMSLKS